MSKVFSEKMGIVTRIAAIAVLGVAASAASGRASTLGDGLDLAYRCVDLDDESVVESVAIYQDASGTKNIGVLKYQGKDGAFVEKKYKLDASRVHSADKDALTLSSANLSVEIDFLGETEPGKYYSRLFFRDLNYSTSLSVCKKAGR